MPAFSYEAANPQGHISKGVMEADSERHVRAQLKAGGLLALSCTPVAAQGKAAGAKPATGLGPQDAAPARSASPHWLSQLTQTSALSDSERTLLIRQLASLLQAGLPQEQALSVLLSQAETKPAQQMLGAVRSTVLEGGSLSQALAGQPATFAGELVAMVGAGEQSGKLALVLENWADYLESRSALKQQVVSSLAYPAIVAVVALLMVLGLMTYVVPQIVGVFQNAKATLPLLTQVMMAASNFLRGYGLYLLAALVVLAVLLRAVLRRPAPRLAWHGWLLRAPLVGGLVQAAQTERFASTLAILIRGGVPMLSALDAAKRTLTNQVLVQQIDTAVDHVRSGSTLARGLTQAQGKAPPKERMANLLTHLIASGEATGRLPDMLTRAAQLQGAILSRKLQAMTTLLEPAIILVMGGVVLVIVLSVLLPIIEINQLVR
jgi:general secretion pathway protein F